MSKVNYKKILEQLIEEYPHDLDKIVKVINDARENLQYDAYIDYDKIIKSSVWNSDEKAKLLILLGYNKQEHDMSYINEYKNSATMSDYQYMTKYDILSGFEALMKTYKDIERHSYGDTYVSKDIAYSDIFDAVITNCKEENKATYIKVILDNLTVEDIKRLIAPYYDGDFISAVHNKSIFINIIASKDLDLIKKYIDYVDDINMYISEAVSTGDIEIVKFFLEKGADINYLTDEVILGRLTPLKTAIVNNDYEMAKFLIDNGADVNLQSNSDNFINRLNNYQIDIHYYGKPSHIETASEEDEDAKQLKYIRTSSPLEYATKLKKVSSSSYNRFLIYFNGESFYVKNYLELDINHISEQLKSRGRIVDLIFDKLEDKANINYTDLISFSFITSDLEKFKKYSKCATDNNYQIDFEVLFKLYFRIHLEYNEEMLIPFMDLIAKYDKDDDMYLKLFDNYLASVIKNSNTPRFYFTNFNKELLNRISKEKRIKICLVPYCKDIDTLKHLISLGFDINQVNENGENILYYLLCCKSKTEQLTIQEIELFDYLLENLNLSIKDNNNKTVLYYAMQRFNTKDEWKYATNDRVKTRSDLEAAVAKLISRMPKEDVCNDDIREVLEKRIKYSCGCYGGKIHFEFVYQHHKNLFDALIDKGFILSDEILNEIFAMLYPQKYEEQQWLLESIDRDSTLDFLYQRLDRNVEIQKINIEQEFKNLMFHVDDSDITFDEFMRDLNNFNSQIISLKQFYENSIKKRFNPERYLQYAYERYNTEYIDLDRYLLLIIIKGIRKFGNEKLVDILDLIPNYDINSYVMNADVEVNYWDYVSQISDIIGVDEEGVPIYGEEHFEAENVHVDCSNIIFNGGLIQYAILIDNLPMVQLLQKRGANLQFITDDRDYTWDYVNSYTMLNYIETFVGEKKYRDMDEAEKKYYLNLVNTNIKNNDEQPQN